MYTHKISIRLLTIDGATAGYELVLPVTSLFIGNSIMDKLKEIISE